MSRAARLGAFIVATLAILAVGVFIIGSKQYLFSSTYQLKAQFDNVEGLDDGADVRLGGVHRGTVHSIVSASQARRKGHSGHGSWPSRRTRSSSRTQWPQSKPKGCWETSIWRSRLDLPGTRDVRDGDTIASQPPLEMSDLLQKTSGILDSSQQAIQNATRATANLDSISAKIDSGQGTAGALVNDKTLYNNLEQTSGAMHDTMMQAASRGD